MSGGPGGWGGLGLVLGGRAAEIGEQEVQAKANQLTQSDTSFEKLTVVFDVKVRGDEAGFRVKPLPHTARIKSRNSLSIFI